MLIKLGDCYTVLLFDIFQHHLRWSTRS